MKALGFTDVVEVAVGADLCATQEAMDFLEHVPEKIPFMATSCCRLVNDGKAGVPRVKECVSMSLTPMVLTARLTRNSHPEAKIAYLSDPARQRSWRQDAARYAAK